MTQEHPLTPPPELVAQWWDDTDQDFEAVATRAARWGADQELEACCELLKQKGVPAWSLLRLHRRPKPPSLKEQALADLAGIPIWGSVSDPENRTLLSALDNIRRALESLPD